LFEKKYKSIALKKLNIKKGEVVLEVGFGSGDCLKQIAKLVGETGKVCGIDISSKMLEIAKKRLEKAKLLECAKKVIKILLWKNLFLGWRKRKMYFR